jgi:hypothetical protein
LSRESSSTRCAMSSARWWQVTCTVFGNQGRSDESALKHRSRCGHRPRSAAPQRDRYRSFTGTVR